MIDAKQAAQLLANIDAIKAIAEGKPVEYLGKESKQWRHLNGAEPYWRLHDTPCRPKPEPKYRPFTVAELCDLMVRRVQINGLRWETAIITVSVGGLAHLDRFGNAVTAQWLLDNRATIDGKPAGVEVSE